MAMVECKECKKEVSDKAETCPHCGIKAPGASTKGGNSTSGCLFIIVLIIGAVIYFSSGSDEPKETPEQIAAKAAACREDLQCWGDKHAIAASIKCDDQVEKLAKYSAKWTDGMLDSKFSRFRWLDKEKGYITYIGDKIQFQNGFGAMQNHIYECDFDTSTEKPMEVRARPGQL